MNDFESTVEKVTEIHDTLGLGKGTGACEGGEDVHKS
jgi:hypothetical protein